MQEFKREYPSMNVGAEISSKSFEIVRNELKNYKQTESFSREEMDVIVRLIHTSSCFDEVLNSIYFGDGAVLKIANLLNGGAKIIVDVNMIRVGVSKYYLSKYNNEIICYVNEPTIFEMAEKRETTRSYIAVVESIKRYKKYPLIFVCGNAPTFIYGAIDTLLDEGVDLKKVAFIMMPVGFVNVIESKDYGERFCNSFGIPMVVLRGRFGGSTMAVATIHSIYKLIGSGG
jgi:precorrin-8X/cobalt-precorrin-8 methylmutase